ncbi:hypothetical protein PVAP13_9NG711414 [Panicum virgatum]|uniref:Uncharacterized protein n=1 Tax=Panicum virgatum TaxID=38727 RepID=A0A8T0N2W0_PANVG|nr:hypothetical protein PVAP13_9NG711414 [Panicum virgatum]KAG2541463.1 hypothetical protein PVAP13_9NG711414 [Panicum virgatum]KAG2541464.1 hypothetical protein PVAP13_9NG711414 [Panicum virgatum]KAG2541465.1 hypothetical protein PVAP13_9NG711414 [Panicum virgatum]
MIINAGVPTRCSDEMKLSFRLPVPNPDGPVHPVSSVGWSRTSVTIRWKRQTGLVSGRTHQNHNTTIYPKEKQGGCASAANCGGGRRLRRTAAAAADRGGCCASAPDGGDARRPGRKCRATVSLEASRWRLRSRSRQRGN